MAIRRNFLVLLGVGIVGLCLTSGICRVIRSVWKVASTHMPMCRATPSVELIRSG